jgi:hypothetical protein
MKLGLNIVGILLALMGLVWFLQGIGVLQGSSMSNQTTWVIIGLVVIAIGAGLLFYNNRRPQSP